MEKKLHYYIQQNSILNSQNNNNIINSENIFIGQKSQIFGFDSYNNNILEQGFSLLLKESGMNETITLNGCLPGQKISELKDNYRKKKKYNGKQDFYFAYNAKKLEENNTLEEEGISDLSIIEVIF